VQICSTLESIAQGSRRTRRRADLRAYFSGLSQDLNQAGDEVQRRELRQFPAGTVQGFVSGGLHPRPGPSRYFTDAPEGLAQRARRSVSILLPMGGYREDSNGIIQIVAPCIRTASRSRKTNVALRLESRVTLFSSPSEHRGMNLAVHPLRPVKFCRACRSESSFSLVKPFCLVMKIC
jgi:hypothetical protein